MAIWGIMAGLLSAASWAFGTVVFERIGKVVPSVGITFLKGALSIVLMFLMICFAGGLQSVGIREFAFLSLSGVIGISIGDSLFFKSLQDLGAKTQVVFFLLGQILTMVLSLFILGELLSIGQYIGAMVLLIGIVVVVWGKQEKHPNKVRGIVCGLLSIICFSSSAIMTKVAISNVDVVTATFYRMVFGTVFTLGFGVAAKQIGTWVKPLKYDIRISALLILNVVVITFGGFLLSMVAIKYIAVSLSSILGTMEPIFVLLFAFLINKERIRQRELIGTFITVVGLYLILTN